MDTRTERALRYQRVLLAQGVDPARDPDSLTYERVRVVIDGENLTMALMGGPAPGLMLPEVADAVLRFDRQFAALREAAPEFTARDLVLVDITDALAHLRRPKREGNRAERRARGRR